MINWLKSLFGGYDRMSENEMPHLKDRSRITRENFLGADLERVERLRPLPHRTCEPSREAQDLTAEQLDRNNQQESAMTKFKMIGPSDVNCPCSHSHPYDHSEARWHAAEIERLVNQWIQETPNAKVKSVQTKLFREGRIQYCADVVYQV